VASFKGRSTAHSILILQHIVAIRKHHVPAQI
jgi:hypothetical protein